MEKWTIATILNAISTLKERNRLDAQNVLSYVLQPLAQSIGYNIFNVDEVEVDTEQAGLKIQVNKEFQIVFSQEHYRPLAQESRVVLHLDIERSELNLHIQSLNVWNTVYKINLYDNDMKAMNVVFNEILKFIEKDKVKSIYQDKREKMFSEIVLQKHLDEEKVKNIYVHKVLEEEVMNPSKDFLELIAVRLNRKYSTQTPESLMRGIGKLNQEGIFEMLEEIVMQNQTLDKSVFAKTEEVAPTEPVEVIENPYQPPNKQKVKTDLTEYTPPSVDKKIETDLTEFTPTQSEIKPIEVPEEDIEIIEQETPTVASRLPQEKLYYEEDDIEEPAGQPVSPLELLIKGETNE